MSNANLRQPTIAPRWRGLGLGGYRLDDRSELHRAAAAQALGSGWVTLAETAPIYTDTHSERCLGQAAAGRPIALITKVGPVARSEWERARAESSSDWSCLQHLNPAQAYCLKPAHIRASLLRSLERLEVPRVSALLIHNPEQVWRAPGAPSRTEFDAGLVDAFEELERLKAEGRIEAYGVSAGGWFAPVEHPEHLSLEHLHALSLQAASRMGAASDGLRVVGFAFNPLEPGALLGMPAANRSTPLLEQAKRLGVATLSHRALNAIFAGRLVRLALGAEPDGGTQTDPAATATTRAERVGATLERCERLEDRYAELYAEFEPAARARTHDPSPLPPPEALGWATRLAAGLDRLRDLDTWTRLLTHSILPELARALEGLESASAQPSLGARNALEQHASEYRAATSELFDALTAWLSHRDQAQARRLQQSLITVWPELASERSLARQVLGLIRSLPEIDATLVGMRRVEYVNELVDPARPLPRLDPERVRAGLVSLDWRQAIP